MRAGLNCDAVGMADEVGEDELDDRRVAVGQKVLPGFRATAPR